LRGKGGKQSHANTVWTETRRSELRNGGGVKKVDACEQPPSMRRLENLKGKEQKKKAVTLFR